MRNLFGWAGALLMLVAVLGLIHVAGSDERPSDEAGVEVLFEMEVTPATVVPGDAERVGHGCVGAECACDVLAVGARTIDAEPPSEWHDTDQPNGAVVSHQACGAVGSCDCAELTDNSTVELDKGDTMRDDSPESQLTSQCGRETRSGRCQGVGV